MRSLKPALLSLAAIIIFTLSGTHVADAVVQYEQDITPDIIFGSGNTNGSFTTDRQNGVEIGLRAKIPFVGTLNSNSNGTYSYPAGTVWNFDWTVNTNFDGSTVLNVSDLTYELGMDGDPGLGTDFLIFDPITPNLPPLNAPFFDHAIGDNSTGNGAGAEATDNASYVTLLGNNNVAQNSWRYAFFPLGALASYDPAVDGTYAVYLLARDSSGQVVARADIQILIGNAEPAGPAQDHYQCYDVNRSSKLDSHPEVSLNDQFGFRDEVKVGKKVDSYCTPVDKNGEGVINPDNTLTCYRIKSHRLKQKLVVQNQFGEHTILIKKSKLLCVPATQISSEDLSESGGD